MNDGSNSALSSYKEEKENSMFAVSPEVFAEFTELMA